MYFILKMSPDDPRITDATLRRLARVKAPDRKPTPLIGVAMVDFFKDSVQKRQTKLSRIADTWARLVPAELNDHCAFESLSRGTLTVIVDTSSHMYELKQLLLAGLQQQITLACKSAGLKKVALKLGRWYDGDPKTGKLKFD
jgi:hypothetical protein